MLAGSIGTTVHLWLCVPLPFEGSQKVRRKKNGTLFGARLRSLSDCRLRFPAGNEA
jgi:hypothetical protein